MGDLIYAHFNSFTLPRQQEDIILLSHNLNILSAPKICNILFQNHDFNKIIRQKKPPA